MNPWGSGNEAWAWLARVAMKGGKLRDREIVGMLLWAVHWMDKGNAVNALKFVEMAGR